MFDWLMQVEQENAAMAKELDDLYDRQRVINATYRVDDATFDLHRNADGWYDQLIQQLARELALELIKSGVVEQRFERDDKMNERVIRCGVLALKPR
jgi:hypothetical protein